MRARKFPFLVPCLALALLALFANACNRPKLDEHGGYFDEKTGKYKYMRPKAGKPGYAMGLKRLQEGSPQQIWGKLAQVDPDLKSVWLHLQDRNAYQMLAEDLDQLDRDDKNQNLKIHLLYVNPLGSVTDPAFKRQWAGYAEARMADLFSGEQIFVTIHFKKAAKMLWGEAFKEVATPEGRVLRNLNLRMIQEGLTYHFYLPDEKEPRKDLDQAQSLAKKQRAGLWNYE